MPMIYGLCLCDTSWAYTGTLDGVPDCGNCGRKHTEEDIKRRKPELAVKDAALKAGSSVVRRAKARK